MQLDGMELLVRLIQLENFPRPRDIFRTSHKDVTLIGIGAQLFDGLGCNPLVCPPAVKGDYRLKANRLK
jgi:hypothetical protein